MSFRPEDKRVVHRGVVKWFDDIKGYGYIQSESGQDVFVHFSEIIQQKGFRSLSPGMFVEFEMLSGEKGPKAMNVMKIAEHFESKKSKPR